MDHDDHGPSTDPPHPDTSKQDREAILAWLSTPESDEPVPDFVERELEKPFEIDLSEWVPVKPSPDFAERLVRAVFAARYQRVRAAMRRKESPVPPKDKLEPGVAALRAGLEPPPPAAPEPATGRPSESL